MNFMRSDGKEMVRMESETRKLMETLSSSFKRTHYRDIISAVRGEKRKFIMNVSEA